METDQQKKKFDEVAQEAALILLEQFWILRDKEPEKYQAIRDRENVLRSYFIDKLGLRLIVHRHFAKLEKIPVQPESWMGIQAFNRPKDYALFCCLLAFLEGKNVDEQFLLTELCEELVSLYPGKDGLDWTLYEQRKSLVRVLQFSKEVGIVRVVDGDIEDFSFMENHEVLYEVPVISRYFMRSYPKDLFQFDTKEEILEAEWHGQEQSSTERRRHQVYRQLLFSPVFYSKGIDDAEFQYVRQYRSRIREDIEKHTEFQFELYKSAALLTIPERKARYTLYPDNKAVMDIALQFAQVVRTEREEEDIPIQFDGTLRLTWVDFEQWVDKCRGQFSKGWSKQYREASLRETTRDLYELLEEWKMVSTDLETGMISLHSLLVRIVGRYPKEFKQMLDEGVTEDEESMAASSGRTI